MAYIFHQDQLPRLEGASGGRVRTFFVNKELTKIDDMLAGVMTYTKGTASPFHYHEVCEHFYFIIEGDAQVETPEGIQPVGPGMMIVHPRRAEAPAARAHAALLLRIPGPESLQDAHPRRHGRGSEVESRGRRHLDSDVGMPSTRIMPNTYIDTNTLPHTKTPGSGEFVEVLNNVLCGAKNVVGTLRWLQGRREVRRGVRRAHQSAVVPDGRRGAPSR